MKLESNLRKPTALHHFAPVVDAVMILLVFFLLGSKLVVQPGLAVTLPSSGANLSKMVDSRVLTVSAGSVPEVFLDGDRVEFAELSSALENNPRNASSLVLRIDQMASFGMAIQVSGLVLEHGYELAYATAPAEAP